MKKLALFGGSPEITTPHPHANRLTFTSEDVESILSFIEKENTISFFGNEPFLSDLENQIAELFGRRFCILTNSGTSALFLAYLSLGFFPKDLIIVPTNTFFATVTPLVILGAIPLFADCHPQTACISLESIQGFLSKYEVKAIIVTHLWGIPANLSKLRQIVQDYNLVLVEDVSLCVGATRSGIKVGKVGHIACLSLGSTKLLSGGQAGAFLTDDFDLYQRAILFSYFGPRSWFQVLDPNFRPYITTGWGLNLRIHPLAAAIIKGRLSRFSRLISQRVERFSLLKELLRGHPFIDIPQLEDTWDPGIWQGFFVTISNHCPISADTFAKALRAEGLEINRAPYDLMHQTALFRNPPEFYTKLSGFNPKSITPCPGAEEFMKRCLFFPLFLDESLDLIKSYARAFWKVVDHINELVEYERCLNMS